MKRPDWKIAVAGGAVAAVGLGGFAAAQSGGERPDVDPIDVRAQHQERLRSLDSPVEVVPVDEAVDASLASAPSVQTVDSVDSVDSTTAPPPPTAAPAPAPAPPPRPAVHDSSVDTPPAPRQVAPAPAPAPAPTQRHTSSIDSPASIASVDSVDSSD